MWINVREIPDPRAPKPGLTWGLGPTWLSPPSARFGLVAGSRVRSSARGRQPTFER